MGKSIYLHFANHERLAEESVGASHWWGYPDLPADWAIGGGTHDYDFSKDVPLTFICQINLTDLPEDCTELPHEGLLLFFADIDYYLGRNIDPVISLHISDAEDVRVIYVPKEDMPSLKRRYDALQDILPYQAQPIILSNGPATLEEPDHQLLGTTGHLEWEDWPEPCEGWRLLLQMDSMETEEGEINFVDWGVLCFLIDPEALKRLDFSNVRAIILST